MLETQEILTGCFSERIVSQVFFVAFFVSVFFVPSIGDTTISYLTLTPAELFQVIAGVLFIEEKSRRIAIE